MLAEISRNLPDAAPPPGLGFVLATSAVGAGAGALFQTRIGPRWINSGLVIAVPNGLAGFPGLLRYAGLQLDAAKFGPFQLLQCLDDPAVAFLVFPDPPRASLYAPEHVAQACADESFERTQTALLVIATLRPGQGLTLNLRAPVLLETRRRVAVQHIMLDGEYPIRYSP